jgi:hypothetical protein
MAFKSTYLGTIQDVSGTSISVVLDNATPSGLTYVDGEGYRIGQIGSFIKIPIGYIDLFGIVTQVGASAIPDSQLRFEPYGSRWIKVQLIGEGQRNGSFQRGISQYPTISDEVHLVSENDLKNIYGQPDKPFFVKIGHIAGAESIPALIDINKLITRHSAIVGTTGSGKSTTVASILNAISDPSKYPSARIIVFDLHGEYANALKERANVFKVNADKTKGSIEKELFIPFWALNFEELCHISFGKFNSEKDENIILERISLAKRISLQRYKKQGISEETLNVDSPIPFSLNKLWFELYHECFATYYSKAKGLISSNYAYEKDNNSTELRGNIASATPPIFKKVKNDADDKEKINYVPGNLNIGQQLLALGSKLRIPRFDFLFKPGGWTPEEDGKTNKDLDSLLQEWIGGDKPITIMDLSGVPNSILNLIIGVLLRIIYDGLFWARNLSQGGRNRPLLLLMEEAHNYLNNEGSALSVVQKIVKEGRKYGIGAMIVSQRPSEVNSTILSQCGTFFALRLANTLDRGHITSAITDNLEGLTNMLPILRTGEAIILGEAVMLPMRTLIDAPPKDKRPDSQDPIIYDEHKPDDSKNPGGWGIKMEDDPNYAEFIEVWRAQNPFTNNINKSKTMNRKPVESSNIASIGYDSETLEIEFHDGGVYQYFNVPEQIYQELFNATSKGKYHASNIKGHFRYSKV